MKEAIDTVILVLFSLAVVAVIAFMTVRHIDRKVERECRQYDIKNAPGYCLEYWKEKEAK